jgi:hypothetical protein
MQETEQGLIEVRRKASNPSVRTDDVQRRMAYSGMLHHVTLARTDVLEDLNASIIRVTRIGELGTRLKNGVFWDVMPCGSCRNRRFGGTYKSHTV